jgi:DnaK suppressor protein
MTLDLKEIRERLEAKRAELQGEAGTLDQETHPAPQDPNSVDPGPYDQGDEAVDLLQTEEDQAILGNEDALLTQVKEALKRLDQGTYGKCIVCGKPIPEKRLEAIPWALLCIEDEEQLEERNLSIQEFLFEQSNMRDPFYQGAASRDDLLP